MPEEWLTTQEATELSGHHPDYIRKLLQAGKLARRILSPIWIFDRQTQMRSPSSGLCGLRRLDSSGNSRARFVWLCIFLIAGLLVGCSSKGIAGSTSLEANAILGGLEEARFSYHYWDEGLAILVWHDFTKGSENCRRTGSTEDPVYRIQCDVESGEGDSFSWKAHTRDGVTAEMWIDDQSYDLSQGDMFLVRSQDDGIQVEQHQRDFSKLEPTVEAINALSSSDPDVADFIARIRSESDSPATD